MRFSFTIVHVPGKELNTADTLSRVPVSVGHDSREETFHHEVKAYVNAIVRDYNTSETNRTRVQCVENSGSTVKRENLLKWNSEVVFSSQERANNSQESAGRKSELICLNGKR